MRLSIGGLAVPMATVFAIGLTPSVAHSQNQNGPLTLLATEDQELARTSDVLGQLQRDGNLRLVDIVADPLAPARSHQRFVQLYQNVRVLGGGVSVQTERGLPMSVFGHVYSNIAVDAKPELTTQDIVDMADQAGRTLLSPPELAVTLDSSDVYRLVYQVLTFGTNGLRVSEIDATTGGTIAERNALTTQRPPSPCVDCAVGEGLGIKGDRKKLSVRSVQDTFVTNDGLRPGQIATYDMRGDWNRAFDVLVGRVQLTDADLARDDDNVWQDSVTVDGHVGLGWTLDYLFHRFGREGLDGKNGPIAAIVHPVDRADFFAVPSSIAGLFHLNAFYCASCGASGIVVLGEGLPPSQTLGSTGQAIDFFAAGIDIIAHELGHAVTEFTSRLIYQGESGALNEAFSDLIGVGTEFFMAETGRHTPEEADYVVGEDVIKPDGVRSLANPLSHGDPDHYSLRFLGQLDNGGVHTNSTIATHAYYLTVEGGTNVTSGVQVSGLGPQNRVLVDQIFYRAFTFLLTENATFSMARAATLQSARDLMAGTAVEQTIATAWTAVGVE